MRPLLLVDVDGPLNPCAAKPYRRPEGYETHRLMTPRWEAAERRRLTAWGLPHKAPKLLRVWLNPAHGPALAALPFDLAWATTWQEEANAFIGPLLGLPGLPYIPWSEPRPEPGGGVFWKTPQIVAWAKGRPFAWVDDLITDADRAWVEAHHPGPALLHHVDPKVGLTAQDFARLADWSNALG
ncbi:hypothetical protein ACFVVA_08880 [Kitasatospora sp. NPDC058048]|uniref:hypothetical protein n=1 Tax=Kitasatospora sp. NPDC058048 TaxID=3346313 RepID=UPI0036DA22F3